MCVCLICNESDAMMKEYNVRRYYETKHQTFTSYTSAEREKVKQITASLLTQQQFFFSVNKAQENATIDRYEVAQLIAQHWKPF